MGCKPLFFNDKETVNIFSGNALFIKLKAPVYRNFQCIHNWILICCNECTVIWICNHDPEAWKEEQNVFPQINSKTHNLRIIFLIFIWSDSFFLINHRGIKASSKYHIQIFISLHKLRNQCLRKNWKYWFFINFRNIFE